MSNVERLSTVTASFLNPSSWNDNCASAKEGSEGGTNGNFSRVPCILQQKNHFHVIQSSKIRAPINMSGMNVVYARSDICSIWLTTRTTHHILRWHVLHDQSSAIRRYHSSQNVINPFSLSSSELSILDVHDKPNTPWGHFHVSDHDSAQAMISCWWRSIGSMADCVKVSEWRVIQECVDNHADHVLSHRSTRPPTRRHLHVFFQTWPHLPPAISFSDCEKLHDRKIASLMSHNCVSYSMRIQHLLGDSEHPIPTNVSASWQHQDVMTTMLGVHAIRLTSQFQMTLLSMKLKHQPPQMLRYGEHALVFQYLGIYKL